LISPVVELNYGAAIEEWLRGENNIFLVRSNYFIYPLFTWISVKNNQ